MSLDYKSAGVDKEAGYDTVERIKRYAGATHNARVLGQIGAFGAFYDLSGYRHPILVSGTDGVGTKLKIAFALGKYDTIGIDAVAMCVNDILCHGAAPQYFLDYLACGKLEPEVAADIVKGVADGCAQANAALIGGETAEMPGFYQAGEYDIAGFAVGVVEKADLIDGSKVAAGDVLIGLPSSGYHSNGYSLLRKIFTDLDAVVDGKSIGEHLLTPTKIYVKPVLAALAAHRGRVRAPPLLPVPGPRSSSTARSASGAVRAGLLAFESILMPHGRAPFRCRSGSMRITRLTGLGFPAP